MTAISTARCVWQCGSKRGRVAGLSILSKSTRQTTRTPCSLLAQHRRIAHQSLETQFSFLFAGFTRSAVPRRGTEPNTAVATDGCPKAAHRVRRPALRHTGPAGRKRVRFLSHDLDSLGRLTDGPWRRRRILTIDAGSLSLMAASYDIGQAERLTLAGPGRADRSIGQLIAVDLDRVPSAPAVAQVATRAYPAIPQVVCFDTALHRSMPRVAQNGTHLKSVTSP